MSKVFDTIHSADARLIASALQALSLGHPAPAFDDPIHQALSDAVGRVARSDTGLDRTQLGIFALSLVSDHLHSAALAALAIAEQQLHAAKGGPIQ